MKKIQVLILLLIGALVFANTKTASYSFRCYKCEAQAKENHYVSSCPGCPTWRMFALEKDGQLVYRCQHGHTLYIDVKTGEQK